MAMAAPTGGLEIIEHVVILTQENRSFDHYYGSMRGVRGFADPTAVTLPTGRSVFHQPDGTGYVLPYPVNDQFMQGTDHGWATGHQAWNQGRHDAWVARKGKRTMTTHRREALPFYYALADAFTICDAYHCSEMGPTNPNRTFLWTGKVGYEPGSTTVRATGNAPYGNAGHTGYTWTTYPERLQAAGKSWRVYQEWDNYTDNPIEFFKTFVDIAAKALAQTTYTKVEAFYGALLAATPSVQTTMLANLAAGVATLSAAERVLYDRGLRRERPDQVLAAFGADVAANQLPAVSWIVAPETRCEHPDWGPNSGAEFTKQLLDKLASNPTVWNKTVVFLNYDENDGFFDHIPPPVPPLVGDGSDGVTSVPVGDEIADDDNEPIGLGSRVPMIVVSPWSRGGNVCSQVFDHTSVLQFLEKWTQVAEPNISAWRRAVCGDLTATLDLTTATVAYPSLPTPVPTSGPAHTDPAPPPAQSLPAQESGTRPARPLPYSLFVSATVQAGSLKLDFSSTGGVGAHFYVYANAYRTDGPWRYTVGAGDVLSDTWAAGSPAGAYDYTAYGPNGFLRRFAGNRVTATTTGNANPEVTLRYAPAEGKIYLKMVNSGTKACTITVRANRYLTTGPWTYPLAAGATDERSWTTTASSNWYDLTATADTADGFTRRFAGHMENGQASTSDPTLGGAGSGTPGPLPATVAGFDSQETSGEDGRASNAVDGNPATIWHTAWSSGDAALPHEIRLDLGANHTVSGLNYLPRQDGGTHGRIGSYKVYLSTDGTTWGTAVTSGTFPNSATLKSVTFTPATARYVRLQALTEAGGGPWTSAAEITVLGT
ncbi:phospholipase C, phosphocholine-specific [Longispora fulva]|nr:phospholipase C, phosphocholine-specific [Longispora fulva]